MSLNVAFFGAGPSAQPYLQVLARRPEVALTAICDADRRAAEQVAAGWQAKLFIDLDRLLHDCRPDLLWICVPPDQQADAIPKAIDLKIPFFVEPPGAVDFAQAASHAAKIKETNLVTAVGFAARYADVVRDAREYVGVNPVPLALGSWMCRSEDRACLSPERLLWMEACRFVDAMQFFCGEVRRVSALRSGTPNAEAALVCQLEFASGSVGVMTCATFARAEPRLELELAGEGWTLTFGENLINLRLAERDRVTIIRRLNDPVEEQVKAFLTAVAGQDPGPAAPSYPEALRTLAVCHAVEVSARQARPVELAEVLSAAAPAKQ